MWGGSNLDFITGEGTGSYPYPRTTKMHVYPTRVAAFQSKYGTSLNVTFTAENMAPTDSWTDAGNYAESFSSAEGNTINIQNEAELARLAYLLNSGEQSFDQDGVINLAADIDLLQTPSYTFEAKTTNYESRFKLVFSANNNDNDIEDENFAFISNGNLIINGTGTLQVFDILGHELFRNELPTANSQLPTANFPAGVYVLRLINGHDVKTQKIVVR